MSSPARRILWYVSSHGWGHAARQREVIRELKLRMPGAGIALVSSVPGWFWRGCGIESIEPGLSSPTAIESNGQLDAGLTEGAFVSFIEKRSRLLELELVRQARHRPEMIITDIDPLPVAAASHSGIPAAGIGNFTWDWILKEMLPHMGAETRELGEMYRWGTYLKLPLGPAHSPFGTTVDAPLLRGGPPGDSRRVAGLLPETSVKCLAAFRHLPQAFPAKAPPGLHVFTSLPESPAPGIHNISPKELEAAGAGFADLVEAADVVITKPGYGIVSQILSVGKRAVLVTGGGFPEEPFLLEPFEGKKSALLLPGNDVERGLEAALELSRQPEPPQTAAEGGRFIAERLHASLQAL